MTTEATASRGECDGRSREAVSRPWHGEQTLDIRSHVHAYDPCHAICVVHGAIHSADTDAVGWDGLATGFAS